MASFLFSFIPAVISLFLISLLFLSLYFPPWLQFILRSAIPCFFWGGGKQKASVECALGNRFGTRAGDASDSERQWTVKVFYQKLQAILSYCCVFWQRLVGFCTNAVTSSSNADAVWWDDLAYLASHFVSAFGLLQCNVRFLRSTKGMPV